MTYLSSTEILYMHNRLVDEMKAAHGIESVPVLKKAIKYIRDNEAFPDKFSKAAALFFAIAKKKPFKDINITTALFTTKVFLDLNRTNFEIERPEIEEFIRNGLPRTTLDEIKSIITQNSCANL